MIQPDDKGRLPLSIREAKPHIHATRINGDRQDGLPDGIHTGGAWLDPEGYVWKALDGRPYANAEYHTSTDEMTMLEELAGQPLFPKNWEYKEANGRRWIVRKKAFILGKDFEFDMIDDQIYEIEKGIRIANQAGWEINDYISLGMDTDGNLFIVDLSSCIKMDNKHCWVADDTHRFYKLLNDNGYPRLPLLRAKAKSALRDWQYKDGELDVEEYRKRKEFIYVYASFYRPVSFLWASFSQEVILIQNNHASWNDLQPHTWVFTRKEIDEIDRYELTWGWSPLHIKKE